MLKATFHNTKNISAEALTTQLAKQFPHIPVISGNGSLNLLNEYTQETTISIELQRDYINVSYLIANPDSNSILKLIADMSEGSRDFSRLLNDFANKFKPLGDVTSNFGTGSSVTILLKNEPVANLKLWLTESKKPYEIEIIPLATEEGRKIEQFVRDNKVDILGAYIYESGDLTRFVVKVD